MMMVDDDDNDKYGKDIYKNTVAKKKGWFSEGIKHIDSRDTQT